MRQAIKSTEWTTRWGRPRLREPDVLCPRPLRTLSAFKSHSLALAQIVERDARARRLMEEVFVAVASGDESEALVADETLDRALRRCHVGLHHVGAGSMPTHASIVA